MSSDVWQMDSKEERVRVLQKVTAQDMSCRLFDWKAVAECISPMFPTELHDGHAESADAHREFIPWNDDVIDCWIMAKEIQFLYKGKECIFLTIDEEVTPLGKLYELALNLYLDYNNSERDINGIPRLVFVVPQVMRCSLCLLPVLFDATNPVMTATRQKMSQFSNIMVFYETQYDPLV